MKVWISKKEFISRGLYGEYKEGEIFLEPDERETSYWHILYDRRLHYPLSVEPRRMLDNFEFLDTVEGDLEYFRDMLELEDCQDKIEKIKRKHKL